MSKNIILYIDSSDNKKTIVGLEIDGKMKKESLATDSWTSQVLLPLIDQILNDNDISLSQLTEIRVNKGPGSFTGIRVGIAVAQTLGWLYDIPVNGRKVANVIIQYFPVRVSLRAKAKQSLPAQTGLEITAATS